MRQNNLLRQRMVAMLLLLMRSKLPRIMVLAIVAFFVSVTGVADEVRVAVGEDVSAKFLFYRYLNDRVKVWSTDDGFFIDDFVLPTEVASDIDKSDDGFGVVQIVPFAKKHAYILVGDDRSVLFDASAGSVLATYEADHIVHYFNKDGTTHLLTLSESEPGIPELSEIDARNGRIVRRYSLPSMRRVQEVLGKNCIGTLCIPNKKNLAIIGAGPRGGGGCISWNYERGEELFHLKHCQWMNSSQNAISVDGAVLAFTRNVDADDFERSLQIVSSLSGKVLAEKQKVPAIDFFRFLPNGDSLVYVVSNGLTPEKGDRFEVWNWKRNETHSYPIQGCQAGPDSYRYAQLSSDGKRLAIAYKSLIIRQYEVATGKLLEKVESVSSDKGKKYVFHQQISHVKGICIPPVDHHQDRANIVEVE